MTSFELGNMIKDRLGSAGLLQYVDDAREQYLEFPDGFFAEVVLKDGSRLSDAQRMVQSIEEELRKQGVELDAIVRATWEVVRIKGLGLAVAESGGYKDAVRYVATLKSGERECDVFVDVTGSATDEIRKKFTAGDLAEYGPDENAVLIGLVTEFVRLELSRGGESYWDPVLHPQLEMNDAAFLYLRIYGPAKAV